LTSKSTSVRALAFIIDVNLFSGADRRLVGNHQNRVDLVASKVCGTLEIKGLTPELDSLVTFFEGEIVGEVGSPGFRTGRFGATEFDDLKHWRRFPAFTRNRLERSLIKPELNLRTAKNKPYVFLRLKERFVVNHRIEAIHGASYAGFYYCCESFSLLYSWS
jgi:hypothetical protein